MQRCPRRIFAAAMAGACLGVGAGCALQKSPPVTVLKSQDFIADPATVPTQRQPEAASAPAEAMAPAPAVSVSAGEVRPQPPGAATSPLAATDGQLNVTAEPGSPLTDAPAPALEEPTLVDAKIGEINGRPIRAEDVLARVGDRLRAAAVTRRLPLEEWRFMFYPGDPPRGIEDHALTRAEWRAFAKRLSMFLLNKELEDQLLAEEARSSLKPNERQGLKYLVEEFAENARRKSGGQAALESKLREQNMTEEDLRRSRESQLLVEYELEQKLRRRIRISWKDVRLYYERHPELYNPPPTANFRLILVPAASTMAIDKVQKALEAGEPFAAVASLPENTYRASEGGRFLPQKFAGEYEQASFFADAGTNDAAHRLKPGEFTKTPFDQGADKAWLFLESIERADKPLSDADVQLGIARDLENRAMDEQRRAYINRLKSRASYTELELMADRLAEIAAQRYWPE